MKKIVSLILSTMIVVSIIPFSRQVKTSATSEYFNGAGTADNPYQISSEEKLFLLSDLIASEDLSIAERYAKAYYKQTTDIHLTTEFKPIGTHPGVGFYGEYNGNHCSITGLNIDAEGSYIGLFGWVKSGTIMNLSVYGNVKGVNSTNGYALIGGIAGEVCDNSTICNCSFNGNISGQDNNIGGIVGQIARGGTLSGCYFNGEVNGSKNIGGLIGYISDQNKAVNFSIKHSYMVGKVISDTDDKSVGGIAGNTSFENADSSLSYDSNFYLYSACTGAVNSGKQTGCIQAGENALKAWYDTLGDPFVENKEPNDFNSGYPIFAWQVTPYRFNGSGTKDDPYQISSKEELETMRDLINGEYSASKYNSCYYVQTEDIDLQYENWTPIGIRLVDGKEAGRSFFGSYNGQKHTINNLFVVRDEKFAGLFGSMNGNGVIENLIVTGEVNSSGPSAGGIVGEICNGGGIVRNCAFIGDISSSSDAVGGIVGYLWTFGSVESCYHNGSVTSKGESSSGGIVGHCYAGKYSDTDINVKNCYHVGAVNGTEGKVGSIIGLIDDLSEASGDVYITNCYARKDDSHVAYNGTATKCECTIVTSNMLKVAYSDLGKPFVKASSDGINNGYPIFEWQPNTSVQGDINCDGKLNVSDLVILQKWLLGNPNIKLDNWKAADLCDDNRLDVFDLCLMRRLIIDSGSFEITPICINLNKNEIILELEGNASKFQLTADVIPENIEDKSVTWTSSNSKVATVSNTGLVTATGSGTAIITAKANLGGKTAICRVNVVDPSIKLNKASTSLYIGGTETLTATVIPSGSAVTWSTSDSKIATVSGGKITAIAAGTATITARITVGGKDYTANCKVNIQTCGVPVSKSSISLYVGGTETITAAPTPTGQTVTWITSNSKIATVSGGKITAVSEGTANITAKITVNGKEYSSTCKVTVIKPSIKLNKSSTTLYLASTETITATVVPSGQTVTWTTSDSKIATVSGGKITAVAEGNASITAKITVNGKEYSSSCTVTVKNPTISLSKSSHSMWIGDTVTLNGLTDPSNQSVSWSSSNTSVATVDGGKVTGVGEGNATIIGTITVNGKSYSANCSVTIKKPYLTLGGSSGSSKDDHVYYSSSTGGFYAGIFNLPSATATPSGNVSWSIISGNASINNDKIMINQPGTVIARATFSYGGRTYSADYSYNREVSFYAGNPFNIRSSPSTSSSRIGSIPQGTSLVCSSLDYSDSTYVWGLVTYGGKTGYVALWKKDRSETNGIITI